MLQNQKIFVSIVLCTLSTRSPEHGISNLQLMVSRISRSIVWRGCPLMRSHGSVLQWSYIYQHIGVNGNPISSNLSNSRPHLQAIHTSMLMVISRAPVPTNSNKYVPKLWKNNSCIKSVYIAYIIEKKHFSIC